MTVCRVLVEVVTVIVVAPTVVTVTLGGSRPSCSGSAWVSETVDDRGAGETDVAWRRCRWVHVSSGREIQAILAGGASRKPVTVAVGGRCADRSRSKWGIARGGG